MSDLPGPEKPLDFGAMIRQELSGPGASMVAQGPGSRGRRVRSRHRIVAMLHEAGWREKDIAAALGYTQSRVSVIVRSTHPELVKLRSEFASAVADNIKDVNGRIKLYANEMLDRLVVHARQDDRPELSRLAARDILHMAGFTPIKKTFVMEAKLPAEELKRVVGKIQEANEVVLNRKEWEVRDTREVQSA